MNPGAVEEAGKVAGSMIEALRASPIVLALVMLQVLTMAAVLYNSIDRQRGSSKQFADMHALLDKCIAGHIGQ